MAQQTAVEWLFEKMAQTPMTNWYEIREKALAMEKEQIKDAYLNACARVTPYGNYNDSAEQYYNETFVK